MTTITRTSWIIAGVLLFGGVVEFHVVRKRLLARQAVSNEPSVPLDSTRRDSLEADVARRAALVLAPGGARVGLGKRTELVAVLITTSTCAGSRDPQFVPTLRRMRARLDSIAAAERKHLVMVAAVLDDSVAVGASFVKHLGTFDEVSLGGNWLNAIATQYLWRDHRGTAAVPQVVLVERDVAMGKVITVSADRVRTRIIGIPEMVRWAE